MRRSDRTAAAILCLSAAGFHASAPGQISSAKAKVDPSDYAASVVDLDDCAAFKSRAGSLPNAVPLLIAMQAGGGSEAFRKGEFESSAKYQERVQALLVARLGAPDRLVIRVPISPSGVSYDADTEIATIANFADGTGFSQEIQFSATDDSRREYVGANAFGAKANVTSIHSTERFLVFRERQIAGEAGGTIRPRASIKLPAGQAKALKSQASLLLLVSLRKPSVETKTRSSLATIDAPYSLFTTSRSIEVEPRCAMIVSKSVPTMELNVVPRPVMYDRIETFERGRR